jgi:Sulfotransferase family
MDANGRMPNFFLVGAAKAGTTSLHAYLGQHPQVFMSQFKEPTFFALYGEPPPPLHRADGSVIPINAAHDLDSYRALYRDAGDAAVLGDASTFYLVDEHVPARLREHVPHARIAMVLRQPVDRAYSHYLDFRFRGFEPLASFTEAFRADEERVARAATKLGTLWAYRSMGLYAPQVARYRAQFPPEQIKVFLYDDWRADPVGVVTDLFRFLGIDDGFVPDMTVRHRAAGGVPRSPGLRRAMERKHGLARRLARAIVPAGLRPRVQSMVDRWNAVRPPLDPAVRRALTEVYRADIAALEPLIGRDLSGWLADNR